ncbi:ead/Ea22-like family protein [Enterobacter hormaechei]
MSNIDKRALRVLATALDGDDWHAEGNSVYGGRYDVGDNVCYDHIASCESVNGKSPHADFIAAANPATVLALLDELEAKDKQIADLKEAFRIALSAAGIDVPAAAGKGE